ncbi:hypothetical protein PS15p_206743 [Mucor circinelloides]
MSLSKAENKVYKEAVHQETQALSSLSKVLFAFPEKDNQILQVLFTLALDTSRLEDKKERVQRNGKSTLLIQSLATEVQPSHRLNFH